MIYLIQEGILPRYKLGYTEHPIKRRKKTHQTSNSHPLRVVALWPGSYEQEQHMHKLLRPWWTGGGTEWYELYPVDLKLEIHRAGWSVPDTDRIEEVLPVFVLSQGLVRERSPQPVAQEKVEANIKRDVLDYYLEFGAGDQKITVGEGVISLLTSGILQASLWRYYSKAEFLLCWSFDLLERYGPSTCLDLLLEEGQVEFQEGLGYRVCPELKDESLIWEMAFPG